MARAGSTVENLYVQRTVTVLAVHEHEVDDLSFMNTLAIVCFSFFSGLLAFAAGAWANAAFAETLTPKGAAMMEVVVPVCVVLALCFGAGGIVSLCRRGSTLTKIREQSKPL